jgi:hypothetical protein
LDALGDQSDVRVASTERHTVETKVEKDCCFVQDDHLDLDKPRGTDIHARANFPLNWVYMRTPSDSFAKAAADSVPAMPDNLLAIGTFWRLLDEEDVEYYFPVSIGTLGTLTDDHDKFKDKIQFSRVVSNSNSVEDFLFPHDRDAKHPVNMLLEKTSELTKHQADVVLQFAGEYHAIRGSTNSVKIHAPVTTYIYFELNGQNLAKALRVDSPSFDRAFYDLLQVAHKNGAYTLPELNEVLSKSELSETPVFEAFGIKFPTDLATLGGIIVLLCVQLYFFVYLRRLYGSLSPNDPGWNVPWIGMDASGLTRTIFFVTVVIFPALSLVVLGCEESTRLTRIYWDWVGNRFHHDPIGIWSWVVKLRLLTFVASVVLSVYVGKLSWTYRPQIARAAASEKPEATSNPPSS